MSKVAIIMGSDSDLPIMKEAAIVFEKLDIEFEISIISAHRTPDKLYDFSKNAKQNGFSVIIAGAGGSAHLPGMVASMTNIPVIGVPIMTKTLNGLDSLYSIVQMPFGIPVATVAINGAGNAALLAAQMIAINDKILYDKLTEERKQLEKIVIEKSNKLIDVGYNRY